MNKQNRKIIVFAKNPIPGRVKTRIGNVKGHDIALEIYLQLLKFTRNLISEINAEKLIYIQDNIEKDEFWTETDFKMRLQAEGDLGRKMGKALENEMEADSSVLLIGSDCGELKPEDLILAFDKLKEVDIVIGPAKDGGYYLIGMKMLHPEIFSDMPWSKPDLLNKTLSKIIEADLCYFLLPEKNDIDHWEDWIKLDWNNLI